MRRPAKNVAQGTFSAGARSSFLSENLILCGHPEGRLAGTGEQKLFEGLLLLAGE